MTRQPAPETDLAATFDAVAAVAFHPVMLYAIGVFVIAYAAHVMARAL